MSRELIEAKITLEILKGMANDVDASDIAKEIMKLVTIEKKR